jgi:hypothetical protein
MHARFVCAYRGHMDYEVAGRRYRVQAFAHDDGHWPNFPEVAAYVGTVSCEYPGFGTFPPPEVLALFPGFVAARYNRDTKAIEYHPAPPEVVRDGPEVRATCDLSVLGDGAGFALFLHALARSLTEGPTVRQDAEIAAPSEE